jgi:hypothetical protein
MTWSIVQSNDHENGNPASSTVSVTFGSTVTSGNLVVAFIGYPGAASDLTGVTDDKGNTYTVQTTVHNTSLNYMWHSIWLNNITNAPITVTGNFGTTHQFISILAVEVLPVSNPVTLDQFNTNQQGASIPSTDAVTSGPVTTTGADFIIAGAAAINSDGVAAGTGFTGIQVNVGGNSFSTEYLVQSSAGTQAGTFTSAASGGASGYAAAVLAFFAATPPPPIIPTDVVGMTQCEW